MLVAGILRGVINLVRYVVPMMPGWTSDHDRDHGKKDIVCPGCTMQAINSTPDQATILVVNLDRQWVCRSQYFPKDGVVWLNQ